LAIFEILEILGYCLSRDISNFISYRNKFQIIIFDVMKDKSSSDVEIEERVNSLLSRMTLEEKIWPIEGCENIPFGHGLSYTRFNYSNLKIIPEKIHAGSKVNVYVNAKNIGEYEGNETVQLYMHKRVSSVSKPVKKLKVFKRITLKPGEMKTISFRLGVEESAAYDPEMKFAVESGVYEIMIGSSSEDKRLQGELQVMQACSEI